MLSRREFILGTGAALTFAGARLADSYFARGPQLEPAQFTDQQFRIIEFLAKNFDVIGLASGWHFRSKYDYLISDAGTLRGFQENGITNLFLEQKTSDQAWIDGARNKTMSTAAAADECTKSDINRWLSAAQNREACEKMAVSYGSASPLNVFAADERYKALHFSFFANAVADGVRSLTRLFFPQTAPGFISAYVRAGVDHLIGGGTNVQNNTDDKTTVNFIFDHIKPGDVSIVEYGAEHLTGRARDRGAVDMVGGLQAKGLKVAIIKLSDSLADRGDYYRVRSKSPNFRSPDIDFTINAPPGEPDVIFNNPSLEKLYRAEQARTKSISPPEPAPK